jgi:hypothetical protein
MSVLLDGPFYLRPHDFRAIVLAAPLKKAEPTRMIRNTPPTGYFAAAPVRLLWLPQLTNPENNFDPSKSDGEGTASSITAMRPTFPPLDGGEFSARSGECI